MPTEATYDQTRKEAIRLAAAKDRGELPEDYEELTPEQRSELPAAQIDAGPPALKTPEGGIPEEEVFEGVDAPREAMGEYREKSQEHGQKVMESAEGYSKQEEARRNFMDKYGIRDEGVAKYRRDDDIPEWATALLRMEAAGEITLNDDLWRDLQGVTILTDRRQQARTEYMEAKKPLAEAEEQLRAVDPRARRGYWDSWAAGTEDERDVAKADEYEARSRAARRAQAGGQGPTE